jgi:hypothetical protein
MFYFVKGREGKSPVEGMGTYIFVNLPPATSSGPGSSLVNINA